jgi:hypothetical protein
MYYYWYIFTGPADKGAGRHGGSHVSWPQENIIYTGNYRFLPEDKDAGKRGGSRALMAAGKYYLHRKLSFTRG